MSLSYRSSEVPAVLIEPTHRRIRLKAGEKTIADTTGAIVIYENGGRPVYYLPESDFIAGTLSPTGKGDASPLLGEKLLFDLKDIGASKAWSFDGSAIGHKELAGFVTVEWSAVRWFEEDEEVFRHARNVHKRIDTIRSSRLVEIFVDGQLAARSNRAVFLFETGLITRYYFPAEDIVSGRLIESELTTYCPYKGTASYFHIELDGKRHDNIVWTYPEPLDESTKVRGLISFYNEKVDEVRVSIEAAS
jgi:uncharacterized protein (DUF427 family)